MVYIDNKSGVTTPEGHKLWIVLRNDERDCVASVRKLEDAEFICEAFNNKKGN